MFTLQIQSFKLYFVIGYQNNFFTTVPIMCFYSFRMVNQILHGSHSIINTHNEHRHMQCIQSK
jgi:hypothetical protein